MKLGFIGLGSLGTPVAENLLASVKELAAACDIVFSIVSDDAALKQITTGDEGIAKNLKAGGIHISISTILPDTARGLSAWHREHHNVYLASPVMGRPETARAGKLNFLVSGEKQTIETVKPILQQAGGAAVWEFGDEPAAANTAKLCSNFLIAAAIEAMAEGIQLAEKSGIDATQWMNMMTQTLFNAPVYINYGNILLKKAYQPASFSLKLGLKDVNLVLTQAAAANASMPIGNTVHKQLTDSVDNGLAEYDWTAVAMALK
jgi:3-hydroxyisobutyrate dehydrogenase-like beta-hydroxyacid dehydrogenase